MGIPATQADPNAPVDLNDPPPDAERMASGLVSMRLKIGFGTEHPVPASAVRVEYTGWTVDGRRIDSSAARKIPPRFTLEQLSPGWREGLQLMVEGEKRRFWIPAHLAGGALAGERPKKPEREKCQLRSNSRC